MMFLNVKIVICGTRKDEEKNEEMLDGQKFGQGVKALFTIDDYKYVAENTVIRNVVEEMRNIQEEQKSKTLDTEQRD